MECSTGFAVVTRTLGLVAIPLSTIRRVTARLGHRDLVVLPRGRRFICECNCGYRSTGRLSEADAAGAGIHHLELVFTRYAASGVAPVVRFRATPDEHTSESRTPTVA